MKYLNKINRIMKVLSKKINHFKDHMIFINFMLFL